MSDDLDSVQTFTFGINIEADNVRITVLDTYGTINNGFSDVHFLTIAGNFLRNLTLFIAPVQKDGSSRCQFQKPLRDDFCALFFRN